MGSDAYRYIADSRPGQAESGEGTDPGRFRRRNSGECFRAGRALHAQRSGPGFRPEPLRNEVSRYETTIVKLIVWRDEVIPPAVAVTTRV
jgi:hypothetical protein